MKYSKKTRRTPTRLGLAALIALMVIPNVATAQHNEAPDLQRELLAVRRANNQYQRLEAALEAGYELGWVNGDGVRIIDGCISHPTDGAMGYHYFNKELMDDLSVDPLRPEVLVYAPNRNGELELVAVEWVVPGPNSNPPGVSTAPSVLGMEMHILVPAVGFYILHAWIWQNNPAGVFNDWNPRISCP